MADSIKYIQTFPFHSRTCMHIQISRTQLTDPMGLWFSLTKFCLETHWQTDRPMNARQGVIKKAHLSFNLLFHKIVRRRHSNLHGIWRDLSDFSVSLNILHIILWILSEILLEDHNHSVNKVNTACTFVELIVHNHNSSIYSCTMYTG